MKKALLVMDYQNDIVKLVEQKSPQLLANAKALVEAARQAQVPVIFVKVAFRLGYPEISPANKSFAQIKQAGRLLPGTPGSDIHPAVAPLDHEVIISKHRVGALTGTDLPTVLRAQEVTHLCFAGIATSGVVLSTLRLAADLDYGLTVVSDACADQDDEVHRVLMTKVFPRQAEVITTDEAIQWLPE